MQPIPLMRRPTTPAPPAPRPRPSRGVQPTVYVIDDDDAFSALVCALLDSVRVSSVTYTDAMAFFRETGPDVRGCVVLDVRMASMSGLEVQERAQMLGYTMPIIFLSAVADVSTAVRAMRHGAYNFLEKPVNPQLLIEQIQGALRLDAEREADRVGVLEAMERFETLSSRERDVLEKVVAGLPNKLVADELGISIKTVEVHRARVMKKMGADSLAELVRMWMMIEANEARTAP